MLGKDTRILVAAAVAHCPGSGVKVKLKLPAPVAAGLKELAVTPGPDQLPSIPLCTVFNEIGASVWQRFGSSVEKL